MKTSWTKGLETDEEKEITQVFKSNRRLRQRLELLINDKIKVREDDSISLKAYDCPNWDKKQADKVGFVRACQEILSLLED